MALLPLGISKPIFPGTFPDFSGGTSGKEPGCQCRRHKRCGFDPWVGKIPQRRKWQPTPVSLLGKLHGQTRLVGCNPWGLKELDMLSHGASMHIINSVRNMVNNTVVTLYGNSYQTYHSDLDNNLKLYINYTSIKKQKQGISVVVQWLGLLTSTANSKDLIPDQGIKIVQSAPHSLEQNGIYKTRG